MLHLMLTHTQPLVNDVECILWTCFIQDDSHLNNSNEVVKLVGVGRVTLWRHNGWAINQQQQQKHLLPNKNIYHGMALMRIHFHVQQMLSVSAQCNRMI